MKSFKEFIAEAPLKQDVKLTNLVKKTFKEAYWMNAKQVEGQAQQYFELAIYQTHYQQAKKIYRDMDDREYKAFGKSVLDTAKKKIITKFPEYIPLVRGTQLIFVKER